MRKRTFALLLLVIFSMTALVIRVGWLQFVRGDELRRQAEDLRRRTFPIEARRGAILDRNGNPLAISINVDSVFAVPPQVKDPEATAALLASVLNMSRDEVLRRITRETSFWWIKRKISDAESAAIKALRAEGKLPGIYTTQEGKRVYPKGSLLAHVLGISGIDSQGLEGLEMVYDEQLRGKNGQLEVEVTALGQEIPGAPKVYTESEDGNTVVLTIDENIQYILERELELTSARTRAKGAMAIVMDVKTGGILGMAVSPTFDPNNYRNYDQSVRRNWAISDAYPPGSVFKPIVAAAALEEGSVNAHSRFYDPGFIQVADRRLPCWKAGGHGSQDLSEAIMNSCNVAFVKIGQSLGIDKFYQYLDAFGLTAKTGIDLPGEASSLLPPKSKAKVLDLSVMSFGQTVTVTPIQMITAIAAIANDGNLMKPYLVQSIRTADGATVRETVPQVVRQVVSQATAREMAHYLERVVSEGTGKQAAVAGYRLAGKTGTAQKVIGGRVSKEKYMASFVGYGPVENPQIAVLVVIDEPQGLYYGGQIAAPIFGSTMHDLLAYLEIPPSLPQPDDDHGGSGQRVQASETVEVPTVLNMTPAEAALALRQAKLDVRIDGSGPVVLDQFPASGAKVPAGTVVILQAPSAEAMGDSNTVAVPSIIGQSMREAQKKLGLAGLRMQAEGSGIAVRQYPVAGTRVKPGSWITVTFAPPDR